MSSTSFSTRNRSRKSAISDIVEEKGLCNFSSWFSMETVFEWDCSSEIWSKSHRSVFALFVQCEMPLSLLSLEFLFGETVRVIFLWKLVPSRCTSARSSQFWVAIHDRLGLWENDREYLCNVHLERQLFCGISSTRTLTVLQFCRVEHHGDAFSWSRSAGLREHPVLVY